MPMTSPHPVRTTPEEEPLPVLLTDRLPMKMGALPHLVLCTMRWRVPIEKPPHGHHGCRNCSWKADPLCVSSCVYFVLHSTHTELIRCDRSNVTLVVRSVVLATIIFRFTSLYSHICYCQIHPFSSVSLLWLRLCRASFFVCLSIRMKHTIITIN